MVQISPQFIKRSTIVTSETCKTCHPDKFQSWLQTSHPCALREPSEKRFWAVLMVRSSKLPTSEPFLVERAETPTSKLKQSTSAPRATKSCPELRESPLGNPTSSAARVESGASCQSHGTLSAPDGTQATRCRGPEHTFSMVVFRRNRALVLSLGDHTFRRHHS